MSDSDYKPRDGSKMRWRDEGDGTGRMRYERAGPMSFAEPLGVNLEGGCSCERNAWGFKVGCPHLGTQRKRYPAPKKMAGF